MRYIYINACIYTVRRKKEIKTCAAFSKFDMYILCVYFLSGFMCVQQYIYIGTATPKYYSEIRIRL